MVQTRPRPPRVKACLLSTGGRDLPVLQDVSLVMKGLACVRNLDSGDVTTRTSRVIDCAFDEFFDPADIRNGGLLILIISGHGRRGYDGGVSLEFQTQDGVPINSSMLQQRIMALPKHCTLEVIVDTCFAEGVVPGLHHILTIEPSVLKQASTSLANEPRSKYNAKVVVWAASEQWGLSYPEANLPGKPGVYSIMIGAIFNRFCTNGPKTTRHEVWESVLNAVEEQNNARRERDLCKHPRVQASPNRIQRPVLLSSVEDPDDVLNGHFLQPIRKG